jgi:hypothetical protein
MSNPAYDTPGVCPLCLTDEDHSVPFCSIFTSDTDHCMALGCERAIEVDVLEAETVNGFALISRSQHCFEHAAVVAQEDDHDAAAPPRRPQRVQVAGDLFHGQVPDGAVYVGRAAPGLPQSRWANPHPIGKPCKRCDGTVHDRKGAVLALFQELDVDAVRRLRRDLAGCDLACWCKPDQLCHGDMLLELANREGSGG